MKLLTDARVRSWMKSYSSYNVRSTKGYSLEAFLKNANLTVDELFNMVDDEIRRAVTAVVQTYVNKDRPSVARNILYAVKALFLFHDRDLTFKHFRGLRKGKRIRYELIPTPVDVYQMAEVAGRMSSKNKAIILCLFQSGVRNNCITHWTYGMVKDYLYPHLKLPVNLKITSQIDTKLSGYGLGFYYTFLGRQAAESLKEYIEFRKAEGWTTRSSDLIFVTDGQANYVKGKPITIQHVEAMMKRVASRSGIDQQFGLTA
ncbi:MAG: hypothetical protein HYY68_04930 [Thaumarchaeota archaeon]|nr:hypothetical protein [Nitrososphaerota archaeon]